MPDHPPDPTSIMQLATGYWNSATLLAANEIDLFSALSEETQTAAQIAERLQIPLRSTTLLLDACVGLGLLHKSFRDQSWAYANTPEASAFLVKGRPGYLGDAIRWAADQYAVWGQLAVSLQRNAPAVAPAAHLGDDPLQTRRFVLGMHNRALGVARGVLHFLDFGGVTRLLDVGGGPGTYAMLLAQKYPTLHATVLDLPGVVAIAQELIDGAHLADRVTIRADDALAAEYGQEAYDGVLFSGVLHQMSSDTIQRLFVAAYRALTPGGKLIVSDMMLDASKTQPPFAALFSLQMLLSSEQGAVFASEECAQWLAQAGFAAIDVQPLPPPLPYTVITARKPN